MYTGVSLDQAPPEDIPIRFFITAPIFGIVAGLFILLTGEELFAGNWSTDTIAFTHIFTLGWLAMIMMGAFYQMVPVLVGGTVPYIRASRYVHALFTLGVVLLVTGIYDLNAKVLVPSLIAVFLPLSFFIIQISIALFKVKGDRPTVLAMRIAIVSLALTLLLGVYFVGAYAMLWEFTENRAAVTATHMVFGLFGWVGGLIMGVGFHVIPMFYMTPAFPADRATAILRLYVLALFLVPAALLSEAGSLIIFLVGLPGLASFAMFGETIFELIGKRRRKITDTTLKAWQIGLPLLFASLLFLVAALFIDHPLVIILFGVLFISGFGLAITTGMLYKIVPFLIWFHRFSLLIGKVQVPHLKNISPDKAAARQVNLYLISLAMLIVGIVAGIDIVVRLGGLVFIVSSAMLLVNLIKMLRMKAPEEAAPLP